MHTLKIHDPLEGTTREEHYDRIEDARERQLQLHDQGYNVTGPDPFLPPRPEAEIDGLLEVVPEDSLPGSDRKVIGMARGINRTLAEARRWEAVQAAFHGCAEPGRGPPEIVVSRAFEIADLAVRRFEAERQQQQS